jgi:hypothetical protein
MCASVQDDGDYCYASGQLGGPLFPMAMSADGISQSIDRELTYAGGMKPGTITVVPTLENEKLRFVKNVPLPESLLPFTPQEQKAEVVKGATRAAALPLPVRNDWLKGIPKSVLPLIRTWLVGESRTPGVTNLQAMATKARTPACVDHIKTAVKAFTEIGEQKVDALAMIAESECDTDVVSPKGAVGLCQFMPNMADKYHLKAYPLLDAHTADPRDERLDPNKCIAAAARYVKDQHDSLDRMGCTDTTIKSLIAYNTGLPNVLKAFHLCKAPIQKTMAVRGEPGNYIHRILGMAYILDANLNGTEVASTRAPRKVLARTPASSRRKPRRTVEWAKGIRKETGELAN